MSNDGQRRAIDDTGRLDDICAAGAGRRMSAFEREHLEGQRLIAQRLGEVASALEDIAISLVNGENR